MQLDIIDFEKLFRIKSGSLPLEVIQLISTCDFSYQTLSKEESDNVVLEVIKKIDSNSMPISGEERKEQWEKGWSENLHNFVRCKFDLAELTPKYYRPNNIMRLNRQYIKVKSATFEFDFFRVFRHWLCYTYFNNTNSIFEFGCGSGCNLPILVDLFPNKKIYGLDWVHSSIDIVNKMKSEYQWDITGYLFDLFDPDYSLEIDANAAFLTFGALEQLGSNHRAFIDFILDKKPVLCVNVEPLYELYNSQYLLDRLAMQYHKKRGYLSNFLSYLQLLEKQRKVKIIDVQRMYFGGMFQDCWSRIVWYPIND